MELLLVAPPASSLTSFGHFCKLMLMVVITPVEIWAHESTLRALTHIPSTAHFDRKHHTWNNTTSFLLPHLISRRREGRKSREQQQHNLAFLETSYHPISTLFSTANSHWPALFSGAILIMARASVNAACHNGRPFGLVTWLFRLKMLFAPFGWRKLKIKSWRES